VVLYRHHSDGQDVLRNYRHFEVSLLICFVIEFLICRNADEIEILDTHSISNGYQVRLCVYSAFNVYYFRYKVMGMFLLISRFHFSLCRHECGVLQLFACRVYPRHCCRCSKLYRKVSFLCYCFSPLIGKVSISLSCAICLGFNYDCANHLLYWYALIYCKFRALICR
jgi:hypothetical protein